MIQLVHPQTIKVLDWNHSKSLAWVGWSLARLWSTHQHFRHVLLKFRFIILYDLTNIKKRVGSLARNNCFPMANQYMTLAAILEVMGRLSHFLRSLPCFLEYWLLFGEYISYFPRAALGSTSSAGLGWVEKMCNDFHVEQQSEVGRRYHLVGHPQGWWSPQPALNPRKVSRSHVVISILSSALCHLFSFHHQWKIVGLWTLHYQFASWNITCLVTQSQFWIQFNEISFRHCQQNVDRSVWRV